MLSVMFASEYIGIKDSYMYSNMTYDDYKIIKVNLDIYDAKTGEFKKTEKNIDVRIRNGVYEIKFIYGWGKCSRSDLRGYDYYYSDNINKYYFKL